MPKLLDHFGIWIQKWNLKKADFQKKVWIYVNSKIRLEIEDKFEKKTSYVKKNLRKNEKR